MASRGTLDRRVGYVASSSLITSSDRLPSNPGRSTLVHTLAAHLDLLDFQPLDLLDSDSHSDDSEGSDWGHDLEEGDGHCEEGDTAVQRLEGRGSEYRRLMRRLGVDHKAERLQREGERWSESNRAVVYPPRRATRDELQTYHSRRFVERLIETAAVTAEASRRVDSRAKRSRTEPSRSEGREDLQDGGRNSSDRGTPSDAERGEQEEDAEVPRSDHVDGGSKRKRREPPRENKNQFGLVDDCPPFDGLKDHAELVAGGSLRAAELLATGEVDIAIAWDGGRHHAKKDAASGFCYVNDAVLAILALRKPRRVKVELPPLDQPEPTQEANKAEGQQQTGQLADSVATEVVPPAAAAAAPTRPPTPPPPGSPPPKRYKTVTRRMDRILYLDLDLHWGDGVEEAFYTSSSVLTLSLHHFAPGFFPCYQSARAGSRFGPPGSLDCEGGPSNTSAASKALSLPLLPGTSGPSLLRILDSNVRCVVDAFDPDCLVLQLGLDGLAADPMAVWNLDAHSIVQAVCTVSTWARPDGSARPLLLLGGGGYHSANAARCWALVTAAMLGRYSAPCDRRRGPDTTEGRGEDGGGGGGGGRVSSGSNVPQGCAAWPAFAPLFTLDVPAGEMVDTNDEAHFEEVTRTVERHVRVLSCGDAGKDGAG